MRVFVVIKVRNAIIINTGYFSKIKFCIYIFAILDVDNCIFVKEINALLKYNNELNILNKYFNKLCN